MQILLRLGLYQTFWLDRIPDYAIVNESVDLARELGCGPQSGFVNAVLRGCLRERDAIRGQLDMLKDREPAVGYSHPLWLCERWQHRWGGEKLRRLLEWNNSPPPTYARVNTLRSDTERLTEQWGQEGVAFAPRRWDWTDEGLVFELLEHPPLPSLPSFQQGQFYIQDPGTLLAVRDLNPQPADTVLDVCAAPGGKTTFIAQLMHNQGRIEAQDRQRERRQLIWENCERLGVTCVRLAEPSASPANVAAAPPTFDRVLLDAPCSNTGVMRRRVELRWRIRADEIDRLAEVQSDLLARAARQLRSGGILVYSTCSLEPEENSQVIQQFLGAHADFKLLGERELLPFQDGVDGAYVARLTRSAVT